MTKDEALKQPEPWEKFCDSNCVWTDHHPDCKLAQPVVDKSAAVRIATALGWTPHRTWVGLTDEEKDGKRVLENGLLFNTAEVQVWELAVQWAEEKLKERNA